MAAVNDFNSQNRVAGGSRATLCYRAFGVSAMDLVLTVLVCVFGLFILGYGVCVGVSMLWAYSPLLTVLTGVGIAVIVAGGGDGTDLGGHV